MVVVRDKRQAKVANKPVDVTARYPKSSKADDIKKLWKQMLDIEHIYAYSDTGFSVDFTVSDIKKTITLFPSTVYKVDLEKGFKSEKHNDVYFELSDMLKVGTVTVVGSKAITKNIQFKFEFS